MDTGSVIELAFQAMRMTFVLAGPILLALLIVGLVLGILQAATSVNESSVTFVPKLFVVALVLLLAWPVSLAIFIDYVREIIMRIPSMIG
jgi:flagellar biosynthesis protein FliQ